MNHWYVPWNFYTVYKIPYIKFVARSSNTSPWDTFPWDACRRRISRKIEIFENNVLAIYWDSFSMLHMSPSGEWVKKFSTKRISSENSFLSYPPSGWIRKRSRDLRIFEEWSSGYIQKSYRFVTFFLQNSGFVLTGTFFSANLTVARAIVP